MWCGEARNIILKTKHTTMLFKQCGIAYFFFLRLFKTSVYREATKMGGSNYDNWLGYEQIILRRRVVQTSAKKKNIKNGGSTTFKQFWINKAVMPIHMI